MLFMDAFSFDAGIVVICALFSRKGKKSEVEILWFREKGVTLLTNCKPTTRETMAKKEGKELTPMMKQFFDLKAKHPDAVLLFRCGDFYETYCEDAVTAAGIFPAVPAQQFFHQTDVLRP